MEFWGFGVPAKGAAVASDAPPADAAKAAAALVPLVPAGAAAVASDAPPADAAKAAAALVPLVPAGAAADTSLAWLGS